MKEDLNSELQKTDHLENFKRWTLENRNSSQKDLRNKREKDKQRNYLKYE